MEEITTTKKMENGIALYYGALGAREFVSFNYSELIDMKINALDLLENPKDYILDKENHLVQMRKWSRYLFFVRIVLLFTHFVGNLNSGWKGSTYMGYIGLKRSSTYIMVNQTYPINFPVSHFNSFLMHGLIYLIEWPIFINTYIHSSPMDELKHP